MSPMAVARRKSNEYKVTFQELRQGMKLLVRSREWWERNATDISGMKGVRIEGYVFVEYMRRVCGQIVTVDSIRDKNGNILYPYPSIKSDQERPYITIVEPDGNPNEYCWTPGMFECIVE